MLLFPLGLIFITLPQGFPMEYHCLEVEAEFYSFLSSAHHKLEAPHFPHR